MAFLFQSNPDRWDLRGSLKPGGHVNWFVTRYLNFMREGVIVLLWEARGTKTLVVKGLYGWGITVGDPVEDQQGRVRIRVDYIERWVSHQDVVHKTPDLKQGAAIQADDVLKLPSWQDHLLASMPIGTNFLVTPRQLEELQDQIIQVRFPASAFGEAVRMEAGGRILKTEYFSAQLVEEVAHD